MDIEGRRLGEDDYDETSLLVPKKYWTGKDGFTPCMMQYWEIK